jgi:hypothetical protein
VKIFKLRFLPDILESDALVENFKFPSKHWGIKTNCLSPIAFLGVIYSISLFFAVVRVSHFMIKLISPCSFDCVRNILQYLFYLSYEQSFVMEINTLQHSGLLVHSRYGVS